MPIGDKPILELIIRQLCCYGFDQIYLCVGHLAHLIEADSGDHSAFGARIVYVHEREPLGTVGPLSLVPLALEPILVLNGDVLDHAEFRGVFRPPRALWRRPDGRAVPQATLAKVDLGVLRISNELDILEWQEKPEFEYQVSMGIDTSSIPVSIAKSPQEMPGWMSRDWWPARLPQGAGCAGISSMVTGWTSAGLRTTSAPAKSGSAFPGRMGRANR